MKRVEDENRAKRIKERIGNTRNLRSAIAPHEFQSHDRKNMRHLIRLVRMLDLEGGPRI